MVHNKLSLKMAAQVEFHTYTVKESAGRSVSLQNGQICIILQYLGSMPEF